MKCGNNNKRSIVITYLFQIVDPLVCINKLRGFDCQVGVERRPNDERPWGLVIDGVGSRQDGQGL